MAILEISNQKIEISNQFRCFTGKTGLGKYTISRYLRTFEADNPQLAEDMKNKKTKEDVVPEDYKKLLEENARLRGELKQAKLRADFYEKMVAFGKETYGIDLKKSWHQVVGRLHNRDQKAYPVRSLCGLLGVSTQAFYKHGDTQMRKLAEEAFVVEYVKKIRQKNPGIGGDKLWRMYKKSFGDEHAVGYNRFYDILEMYGLKVRKRKRRAKTTDSDHSLPTYPNLIKALIPIRSNQLWVSDITYMVIYEDADTDTDEYKFCYLSLVTDYYTKEIVGWCVGETLEAKFTIEA